MNREELRELLGDYLEGTLESGLREEFERALAADPEMKQEADAQGKLIGLMRRIRPPQAPPSVRAELVKQLRAEREMARLLTPGVSRGSFLERLARLMPRWQRAFAVAFVFVAAATVALIAGRNYFVARSQQPPETDQLLSAEAPWAPAPAPSAGSRAAKGVKPAAPRSQPAPQPPRLASAITGGMKTEPPAVTTTYYSYPTPAAIASPALSSPPKPEVKIAAGITEKLKEERKALGLKPRQTVDATANNAPAPGSTQTDWLADGTVAQATPAAPPQAAPAPAAVVLAEAGEKPPRKEGTPKTLSAPQESPRPPVVGSPALPAEQPPVPEQLLAAQQLPVTHQVAVVKQPSAAAQPPATEQPAATEEIALAQPSESEQETPEVAALPAEEEQIGEEPGTAVAESRVSSPPPEAFPGAPKHGSGASTRIRQSFARERQLAYSGLAAGRRAGTVRTEEPPEPEALSLAGSVVGSKGGVSDAADVIVRGSPVAPSTRGVASRSQAGEAARKQIAGVAPRAGAQVNRELSPSEAALPDAGVLTRVEASRAERAAPAQSFIPSQSGAQPLGRLARTGTQGLSAAGKSLRGNPYTALQFQQGQNGPPNVIQTTPVTSAASAPGPIPGRLARATEPAPVINVILNNLRAPAPAEERPVPGRRAVPRTPGAPPAVANGPDALTLDGIDSHLRSNGVQTRRVRFRTDGRAVDGLDCSVKNKDLPWVMNQLSSIGISHETSVDNNAISSPVTISNAARVFRSRNNQKGMAFYERVPSQPQFGQPRERSDRAGRPLNFQLRVEAVQPR